MVENITVPPSCRSTVAVEATVPAGQDVSTWVQSDQPIIAERPMYFNASGISGGHVAEGVGIAKSTWYFAEGTTMDGFDTYLTVQNPGSEVANVNLTFMVQGGDNVPHVLQVPATSRETIAMRDIIGHGKHASTLVEADRRIVVERPMYFNYHGVYTGGHDCVGVNEPSKEWHFAEGNTYSWNDMWLCIQNPNTAPANITINYMLADGSEQTIPVNKTIGPLTRETVDVRADVEPDKDVACSITSDQPIVVERPMYFNYQYKWTGGHNTMGSPELTEYFFFAEGTTRPGYDEWITVINPHEYYLNLYVTFVTTNGDRIFIAPGPDVPDYTCRPYSRLTINVNADIASVAEDYGIDPAQDIAVEIISNLPVIAERPMYFNTGSSVGGHNVMCIEAR